MWDWLFSSKCPVAPDRKVWLERGLNWLGGQFGVRRMLARTVILPTPAFFPEAYDGSFRAACVMFNRVCQYMEVARERIHLTHFVGQRRHNPFGAGYTESAAGLYHEDGLGRVTIEIDDEQLKDPMALVGTMAHELGHVHLLGDRRLSPDSPDHEPLTDLLTVLYGLGIFNANSVIRESNWTDGHLSGYSVGRLGYLTGIEYGYAFALLAQARGELNPAWAKHLRLDVRSAFWQGMRFLRKSGEQPFIVPAQANSSNIRLADPPEDDVPWSRPRPAGEEDEDEDELPPWRR